MEQITWFNRFNPAQVASTQSFLDYQSEKWIKTLEIIEQMESGTISTPKSFRSSIRQLSSINWEVQTDTLGIQLTLTQQILQKYSISNFYTQLVPWIASHIKNLPQSLPQIPILSLARPSFNLISRRSCIGLLGALFFASTNGIHQFFCKQSKNWPFMHCKLISMVNYFSLMQQISLQSPQYLDTQISFQRIVNQQQPMSFWSNLDTPLSKLTVVSNGGIQDYPYPCIQADFANKFIGGGALQGGNVQQEIAFGVQPQLYISMLISDVMQDNEAIMIVGSRRTTLHRGYGSTFSYIGRYEDNRPLDSLNRIENHIVAFDALEIFGQRRYNFQVEGVLREINKAYTAFLGDSKEREAFQAGQVQALRPVCTGKWGCGMFGGEPQIKTLIQWIAASRAGRAMVMMTFQDPVLEELPQIVGKYENCTVGMLLRDILEALPEADSEGIFEILKNKNAK